MSKARKMLESGILRKKFKLLSSGQLLRVYPNGRQKFCIGSWKDGYRVVNILGTVVKVHQIVFVLTHGYLPKGIDHRDKNRANNLPENLRKCTQAQNACNRPVQSNNKTGVKGLSFAKSSQTWRGDVYLEGEAAYFQSKNKQKVIAWIKNKRAQMHGEFAHD
jgi:hypothetical protein